MKNYYVVLQDKNISNKSVSSLLFKRTVTRAQSGKQLAKVMAIHLKADDYELKYFRSMKMFVLRLIYTRNKRLIAVTYHIYPR